MCAQTADDRVAGVVLLRGPGLAMRVVAERLGSTRRVLLPCLPDEPDLDALAARVAEAVTATATDPMDVIGDSLGALIAAATAARHPDVVRRLVLIGGWTHPSGTRDRFTADFWNDLLSADSELAGRFSVLLGFSPPVLDALGDSVLVQVLAEQDWPRHIGFATALDVRTLLPAIEVPTLVIGFAEDHLVSVEGAKRLHAGIRGSRYVEIGGGHYDWTLHPAELLGLIEEFLAPATSPRIQGSSTRRSID